MFRLEERAHAVARARMTRGVPPPRASTPGGGGARPVRPRRERRSRALYTATLGLVAGASAYVVFHASMASSPIVVRRRMQRHVGTFGAAMCRIRRGFDSEDVIARALVTDRLAEMLVQVEADPTDPRARGLYVHHVERTGVAS